MRYGFDYLTSGGWSGNWSELQFVEDTTVTLTTLEGVFSSVAFVKGAKLVGNFIGIVIISGSVIAYRRGTAGAVNADLLLDLYPATAAYSLRKLKNTYSGSAIRVRRASDNTEQDIGFIGNVLNTAALTSFCTGTDGFVTTWYDQQGSNNATQVVAGQQGQIVSSGSLITQNGKPAIQLDGSDDGYLTGYTGLTVGTPADFFGVLTTSDTQGVKYWGNNSARWAFVIQDGSTSVATSDRYAIANIYKNGALQTLANRDAWHTAFADGVQHLSYLRGSIATNDWADFGFFGYTGSSLGGKSQEIILYTSDQIANRTAIESNINGYYNIYP